MLKLQKMMFILFCSLFAINAQEINETDARCQRALKQLDEIDLSVEEISQSINAGSIRVNDKKAVSAYIKDIRSFISDIKNGKIVKICESNLAVLLEFNKSLLSHLDQAINNKFSKVKPFEVDALVTKAEQSASATLDDANAHLVMNANDRKLRSVVSNGREFGLSWFNKFARNWSDAYRESGVKTLTERLTPYVLLTAYLTYITPLEALPEFLHDAKNWMGGNPDKGDDTVPVQKPDNTTTTTTAPSTANNKEKTKTVNFRRHNYNDNGGVLGSAHYHLARILELDLKPVIALPIAAAFTPTVTKDCKDLWNWSQEKTKQFTSYLKNEPYEAPAIVKGSKQMFSDIIGFDHVKLQLNTVVSYFDKKSTLDRIGANIDRGFLFVGPLDLGKSFVYALAGEISAKLKAAKKPTCGVYEIHSSSLIEKKIEDIIKEIESEIKDPNTPTILFIEDINWLCEHAKGNPQIWSSLVNAMNKNLSGTKKQICIIATAQESESIHSALKSQGRLGYLVQFEAPTLSERKAFLIKELTNRGMRLEEFDVNKLALNTEKSTYSVLSSIMKSAANLARTNKAMLCQNHIEQCIDAIVHGIIPDNRLKDNNIKSHASKQQAILASHYAGQAVAHLLMDSSDSSSEQLVKVTLLPVGNKKQGIKLGSLITHSQDRSSEFATKEDLRRSCVIKLAGIESQRLLHGEPTSLLLNEVKAEVNILAKQIVFAGDDEKSLPKDIRQSKLTAIYNLIEQCSSEAAVFVKKHVAQIEHIAKLLQSRQTLTAEEIKANL